MTRQEAATRLKSAIDVALLAQLTAAEIQAILTAHLIDKDNR